MPSLIAYQKHITTFKTYDLDLPYDPESGSYAGQELALLPDGRTVVAIADGFALPDAQSEEIKHTITHLPADLPAALKDLIRQNSPHARLINQRVQERIRAKYSVEDETGMTRIGMRQGLGVAEMTEAQAAKLMAYDAHVESCLAWGREERAKLGL